MCFLLWENSENQRWFKLAVAEYRARIRISEDVCTEIGPEIIVTNKMCAWMWHSEHSSLAPFVGCLLTTLLKDSIIDSFIKTFHICPIIIFLVLPWTIGHCGNATLRTWLENTQLWGNTTLKTHDFEETQLWGQHWQCFKVAVPVAFVLKVAFPQCRVVCPQCRIVLFILGWTISVWSCWVGESEFSDSLEVSGWTIHLKDQDAFLFISPARFWNNPISL